MNVLVTSAASPIAQQIINTLSEAYNLKLSDLPKNCKDNIIPNQLGHGEQTENIVHGINTIINIGYLGQHLDRKNQFDYHTRCIYNLLFAASRAKVRRLVNISTLKLYQDYEENLVVTEQWRTYPPTMDIDILAAHMCESICKEFARDGLIQVINLRIGWPTLSEINTDETAAISYSLLTSAINAVLMSKSLDQWQDIHLQSPVKNQRFSTAKAQSLFPELKKELAR